MIRNWSHRSRLATAIWILITCCTAKEYNNTITKTDDQRLDGPIIIPSLNEITLEKGQNFTLVCKGNNPIQLKQQHIPEDKFGTVFSTNQRNVPTPDPSYKYTIALDLYNVDHFAVGYYACYDDTIEYNDILLNIMEEPSNTEHVAFFYVYVNGTESIFAPMRQVIIARSGSKVVIGCRPTTPDIKVSLSGSNKTPELLKYSPKVGFLVKARFSYECEGRRGNDTPIRKPIYYTATTQPKPKIIGEIYFLEGETFSLNCTVDYQKNIPSVLTWAIPRNYSKGANTLMQFLLPILKPESLCVGNSISIYTTMPAHGVLNHTNEFEVTDGTLYNNITILTATAQDAGTYTCISKIGLDQRNTTFQKRFAEKGFINLTKGNKADPIVTNINAFTLHTLINAYPYANVTFYRDGKEIPKNTQKYIIKRTDDSIDLTIKKMDVYDTGIYTVVANNRHVTQNVTYDLRRRNAPTVNFGPEAVKKYMLNTTASLECEAVGYPLPTITWVFRSDNGQEQKLSGQNRVLSTIRITSLVQIPVRVSGTVTCYAAYNSSTASASKRFLVHEIFDGFGIKNSYKTWFSEKQKVELTCLASIYDFKNLTWLGDDNEELFDYVHYSITPFSHVAVLVIDNILLEQAGNYTCLGIKMDDSEESQTMVLTVEAIRIPSIIEPKKDLDIEVDPYQTVQFSCEATAVPPPQIIWYKDEIILSNSSGVEIFTTFTNQTAANSTVTIPKMSEQYKGKYECIATSDGQVKKRAYNLVIKDGTTHRTVYLSIIGVIGFVLILLVIYLAWKIRKEKQFKQELAAAGLLYFKEGVTKSLNPELGIDEQAELLPYNEKFEFPADKLELGKQLGAGAFGVVYKAEARGIIDAEETTPVAVKMVKKTADNMYIKALASELKIMVHLGKHINIVNLLGACTQNVGKRELIVIVEYCKFGNIHNYMQRHREVFIDQLTDNKEKNLGKVNKAFSCSSGTAIMHSADYFGSNHTQETDHTFVNSANTSRSGRKDNTTQKVEFGKVSETGYIPEWRSNYESDYSFDGRNPRPLTSRDLLAWAFQIARGMEYLASRKVLHGDLAARNVLLAEGNIVKICDFGLARSICKNDEYKKKENSPLPVKWLALECMTDRIFSTQSDVWSFGIVLWELFSLAKTPYPNISPQNLLQWLSTGHRLEKPPYADDRLYDVMMRCWDQKPTLRPSFSHLQEILGSFLEDNVRNHYVDLNTAYMDTNDRAPGDDYLAMVCAPDYNNMVTPSPHLYVNETGRFFPHTPSPAQLQHDDEGYLQMTPASQNIFSPRTQGTNFDFDARKLNPRVPEDNVHGSELTPMLRSSDLRARSGSDSDHDANSSAYLKMFSRISEEADEVFETKLNNIKNTQNTAVSNPTYIKFEADIEKKPNNISSNYINVNVPNGLVK